MNKSKLGIRQKLVFAFGLILATTLVASAIALYAFTRFSDAMTEITQQSVPFMAESMERTRIGMHISAMVPRLAESKSLDEAQLHTHHLQMNIQEIEQLTASAGKPAIDGAARETQLHKNNALQQVKTDVEQLSRDVETRLNNALIVEESLGQINQSLQLANEKLWEVIDRATFDVVIQTEEIFNQNSELLDTLLHDQINSMVNTLQTEAASTELAYSLTTSIQNRSASSLATHKSKAVALLEQIQLERATLRETGILDLDTLDQSLTRLANWVNGENSIYNNAWFDALSEIQVRTLLAEVEELGTNLSLHLTQIINTGYSLINNTGQQLNQNVSITLPSLMYEGVDTLVSLMDLRAELNTLGGISGSVARASDIAELQPLADRYLTARTRVEAGLEFISSDDAMRTIASEINSVLELSAIDTGIFKQVNTVLTDWQQVKLTEAHLNMNQEEFSNYLIEQVRISRSEVVDAGDGVISLIKSSRIQLLLVSLMSIITTALIFWLLISKNLLARLLQTITALRLLADGSYEVSVNSNGTDELSDLARTVEVFRRNALEAQKLQDERTQIAELQLEQERKENEREEKARAEEAARHKGEQAQAALEKETADKLQQRVDKLLAAVSAAAEGNLSFPIDTNGDDLAGQMGSALATLFSGLRSSMRSINENASQLTLASESMTTLAVDMNSIASSNTESALNASTLTYDVGLSVDSVASATEKMSSSIKEIACNTEEAETVAAEAVKLAQATDITVRKLADSSDSIGQVIKVINSIAEQTNLLALNATIEAARAGEAGKGFAVVATEVKELAKETARATEQIESRISDIQLDTDSAVIAIESISTIIDKISTIQSAISSAVNDQSTMTQDISRSIMQTADGSQAISSLIEGVAEKAKSNQQASNQVNKAAGELSEMAAQLQGLVRRYAAGQENQTQSS